SGDRAYVQGLMVPPGPERQKHFEQAADYYRQSIPQNEFIQLRYFTDGALLREMGVDRETLRDLPVEKLHAIMQQVRAAFQSGADDWNREDRMEYERYVNRAEQRLQIMGF